MKRTLIAGGSLLSTTLPALAHSGHEAAVTKGNVHWLTEADHLIVVALAVLAVGLAVAGRVAWRRLAART